MFPVSGGHRGSGAELMAWIRFFADKDNRRKQALCEREIGGQRGGVRAGEGQRSTEESPGCRPKDKLAATPFNCASSSARSHRVQFNPRNTTLVCLGALEAIACPLPMEKRQEERGPLMGRGTP